MKLDKRNETIHKCIDEVFKTLEVASNRNMSISIEASLTVAIALAETMGISSNDLIEAFTMIVNRIYKIAESDVSLLKTNELSN